jgi:tryptophanyl-tRNA synthetase
MSRKKIILSGMRPTGKLHLGHLVGALENWVSLQKEYQNYHLIADYHALTTNTDTSLLYQYSIEMLVDWLAAGLDPGASPMFRQSQIKEHTELHLIFSMLITTARLERNPTLKDQVRDLNIENIIYGHLGYPVLQAADILIYKGEAVPVGEDQVPHVEITREIARKFNTTYGEVFPEPEPLLTTFSRLPSIREGCESGALGCVECKKKCAASIAGYLAPIRERRVYYESNLNEVKDILQEGERQARVVAHQTMADVHSAMKLG